MAPLGDAVLRATSPSLFAATALVCIQVSKGVLFKAVQDHGRYSFSVSSSVAVTEFLKLCISTVLFHRSCRQRLREQGECVALRPSAQSNPTPPSSAPHKSSKGLLEDEGQSDDDDISLEELERPAWKAQRLTIPLFLRQCAVELNRQTIISYGHLALLYAAINNTVFILFELADPGTISLIKSGITLITALVLMFTLGTKIVKLQWVAIALQVCGLIVTQYSPGTGLIYPMYTYAILGFQTFCAANAGVFNQHLLKSQDSSMHAQSMALYTVGVYVNTVVHFMISWANEDEPGFFDDFDQVGTILVVISGVLTGLTITAVYKYADALIKCFASSFSSAILLYISPIAFGADFSFLIFPGTIVVFIATWLYMDSATPKTKSAAMLESPEPCALDEKAHSTASRCGMLAALSPSGTCGALGLFFTTCVAISGIVSLHAWASIKALEHSSAVSDKSPKSPFRIRGGLL